MVLLVKRCNIRKWQNDSSEGTIFTSHLTIQRRFLPQNKSNILWFINSSPAVILYQWDLLLTVWTLFAHKWKYGCFETAVLPNAEVVCTTQLCRSKVMNQNKKKWKRQKTKRLNYNICRKFSKKLKCPRCGRLSDWLFRCGTAFPPGIISSSCRCWQTHLTLPTQVACGRVQSGKCLKTKLKFWLS